MATTWVRTNHNKTGIMLMAQVCDKLATAYYKSQVNFENTILYPPFLPDKMVLFVYFLYAAYPSRQFSKRQTRSASWMASFRSIPHA